VATIIMVHGAFCGGWVFDAFRTPFEAAGHRVLAPTLPGHSAGESAAGRSIGGYAEFIANLAEDQAEPPLLLGHSMGGLVAQMAADRAASAGLVLLAPSSPWGVTGHSLEEGVNALGMLALGAYWLGEVPPDPTATRAYSLDRMDRDAQVEALASLRPESGRALFEVFNWWLDPMMTTAVREAGGGPSLTLAGGRDRINPAATVRRTAERLDGDYRRLDGMSHWLIGEPGWEGVADACLEWIKACG
jgi:pimeloyl-ACP methyl ester carboxylesterase